MLVSSYFNVSPIYQTFVSSLSLFFLFFSFHLIYSPPSRRNFLSEQRIQEVARFLFPLPRFFPPRIVHTAALQRRNFSSL